MNDESLWTMDGEIFDGVSETSDEVSDQDLWQAKHFDVKHHRDSVRMCSDVFDARRFCDNS